MDKIYIKSQFIENINNVLGKPYFEVIVTKTVDFSTSTKYEILLVYEKEIIMRIKVDSQHRVELESELESKIINNLM